MIFLLSVPIVLAQNITIPKIPNITIPNITVWNQTRTIDVFKILRSISIPDIVKERLRKIYDIIIDALVESIAQTLKVLLPDLIQLLIEGNITNKTNVSS